MVTCGIVRADLNSGDFSGCGDQLGGGKIR